MEWSSVVLTLGIVWAIVAIVAVAAWSSTYHKDNDGN